LSISKEIAARLKAAELPYHCNDNISDVLTDADRDALVLEVQEKMQAVLEALVIDTANDHNTAETAKRVAKMFVHEIFSGRYLPQPRITAFPNAQAYEGTYIAGPISIKSTCGHHFQNIVGNCWIGIFPGTKVIGLSKFNRIVEWVASRPQIQEEMTVQIADEVERLTGAHGLAVVVKAEHMCLTHRGVKAHGSDMTTTVLRGMLKTNQNLRNEFFSLLKTMKGI
jgi:GTP cyclohydrolase I